jgi:hypothetical protein
VQITETIGDPSNSAWKTYVTISSVAP